MEVLMEKKTASWTVMVYLAGDNNLTSECMFALTEMKKAALGKEVNVIAQFDPSDPYLPTHRYEINCGKGKDLYSDVIGCARYDKEKKEVKFQRESTRANALAMERESCVNSWQPKLDEVRLTSARSNEVITDDTDSASPVTLYNFISFCLEEYPAERYMIVLSGHAAGTERDYLLKDESSARSLTFNELKQVFMRVQQERGGKLIDIVGMDNCLMSMAEICYELRGLADIVVGCESFSPTSGWPYRQILERLNREFANPQLPEEQVNAEAAKAIVEEYVNYYSTYWVAGLSVTQSALRVSKVESLWEEINKLGSLMETEMVNESGGRKFTTKGPRDRPFANSVLLAHWEAQSYNGEQFVDLYDLCDCLESRVDSEAVADQCQILKRFIEDEFVLQSCYVGATYQYSYGVSIYFPWGQIAASYWNLDFVCDDENARDWGSFLRTYTALTRRIPRGWTDAEKVDEIETSANISLTSDAAQQSSCQLGMVDHRMFFDRMFFERMFFDRMGSSRNRIHSMRNPPNVFLANKSTRDAEPAMEIQRYFRLR